MTMNQEGFPVFKGLQKPLEFMGIRGRFLTLAALAVIGLVTIFVKQRGGLHNKRRDKGIFIYNKLRKSS